MLTHHTTSPPARCSCVSRSRVHSRRRMMFRCAGYTRSGTARAGGEVTHPLQWSSEVHAPDLALIYYKTPDGCKAGWTCAKHAPRRGEDSMGGSESRLPTAVRQAGRVRSMAMTGVTKTLTGAFHGDVYVEEAPSVSLYWGFRLTVSMLVVSGRAQSPLERDFHCWPNCNS